MNVSLGGEEGGEKVFSYEKDLGCPVTCPILIPKDNEGECERCDIPCCCLLPAFKGVDKDGDEFSESRYICDQNLYVPKFDYMENGEVIYRLSPPTCCGGCCIACECGARGCCNIAVPFYF